MLSHTIMMGRLTRDAETRFLQGSNNSVTRFTLAVERDFKAANEEKPKTDFINCLAWNKTGEFIAKYFSKGSLIAVEGRIETRSYTDKETGKMVYTTELNVSKAFFTGERREEGSSTGSDGFMNIPDGIDEDLPFN